MRNQVVSLDVGQGQYKVCGKLWTVGARYILHELVGAGSYGDVCKATDSETNQFVALKRIPNILSCSLLVKRVLREVCIMRRLSHPYIISLTDVFVNESSECQDGSGIDLYIATEFADWGDIYHFSGPVSANEVKFLLWQLLAGVKYLHSCRVWHRDIKSENVLLTSKMRAKICDFGLSRSAEEAAADFELREAPVDERVPIKKVLRRQYTKMVVTPSYRAPEVIMSKGQYNSTIDIWSLGCIFWELLIRSINPHIVGPLPNPLFGVRGEPVTPDEGENYTKDSQSPLAQQLDVIFNVIGTPCWRDIESIPSETWRAYLRHLPGRAGNLVKALSRFVDEEAIDLLSRMLAFNPARRCTAEEALAHSYFKNVKKPSAAARHMMAEDASGVIGSLWKIKDPSEALEHLERELEASEKDPDGGSQKLQFLLQSEVQQQQVQNLIRRSFLCSLAAAKLQSFNPMQPIASSSVVQGRELALAQVQGSQLAAQLLIPVPVQYEINNQEKGLCSCDSHTRKIHSVSQTSEDFNESLKKRAVPKKTIIRQGSLRVEIDTRSTFERPRNALLAQDMDSGVTVLAKQELNSAGAGFAGQPSGASNFPTAKETSAGSFSCVNGMSTDMFLPRRSPRFQDEGRGIPLRKRTRILKA